ncbi:hypothetical protein OM076_38840 [Solirubrobacter ginsenosidimutans]|uniref:Uncharacterized protein n=1 Tax=Solirubrobacter ginsenosidimutans TaxID=490573 RepID=A0A9X3N137_9ACTN|nr:hypothetical protein [Solirubrobacter ginsenosidimutans]MDA0166287.1 hypothetical protein [Solirubrobacter ginsenosidimutans]
MRRFFSRLAVYFGLEDDPTRVPEVPWSELSPLRRVVHTITAIAYFVMAIFFGWSLAGGEDSIPAAVSVASLVAALIVLADAGTRLYAQFRGRTE